MAIKAYLAAADSDVYEDGYEKAAGVLRAPGAGEGPAYSVALHSAWRAARRAGGARHPWRRLRRAGRHGVGGHANESFAIAEQAQTKYCVRQGASCDQAAGKVTVDAAYVVANAAWHFKNGLNEPDR
jgi:hypothetical protein